MRLAFLVAALFVAAPAYGQGAYIGPLTLPKLTLSTGNLASGTDQVLTLTSYKYDGTNMHGIKLIGWSITSGGNSRIASFWSNTSERVSIYWNGHIKISVGNTSACPVCDVNSRGRLCYVGGGAGVKDTLTVCAKDAGDVYAERTIY